MDRFQQLVADPFWRTLEVFGDKIALTTETGDLSYSELVDRVDRFVADTIERLPDGINRPLLLIEASNHIEPITAYLGSLRAQWPVILTEHSAREKTDRLQSAFRPNLIARFSGRDWIMQPANTEALEMAPELAVMLSTSGSTGSEKLVRLSHRNLASNAAAIVDYLGLSSDDGAITSLPWHYSYGMSVLNMQLSAGGRLTLTDQPLTDRDFWKTAQQTGTTVLPLVPMQFDVLSLKERIKADLPSLKYLLQAGGKLDRSIAEAFFDKGDAEDFKLFLMYGQTEAAPRISYLPPSAPRKSFDTIGQAIPGGHLRIVDQNGTEISECGTPGELVYTGPNVMMGYAETAEELSNSGQLPELLTGDIAEKTEEGFFRIVGRSKRFVKLNGLRISLDQVEANLRDAGVAARVTGSDQRLDVFLTDKSMLSGLRDRLCRDLKLSFSQVSTQCISEFPQLPSGKVDYRTLQKRADELAVEKPPTTDGLYSVLCAALRTREPDLSVSFRDHGGDSLAYLEVELTLSEMGLEIPENWEDLPLSFLLDLKPAPSQRNEIRQLVSVDLVLRILAITAVVAGHATTWKTMGGAYFLLVLSGYSIAKFQGPTLFTRHVVRAVANTLVRILVWYYLVLLFVHVVSGAVPLYWWVLISNYQQVEAFTKVEWFWYVPAMAQVTVMLSLPFMIQPLGTWISRNPFYFGVCLLAASIGYVTFMQVQLGLSAGDWRHTAGALQLAVFGWCAYYAKERAEKLALVSAVLIVIWLQWFETYPTIQAFITFGTISLVYGFQFKLRPRLARMLAYVGTLTLPIYMLHVFAVAAVQRVGIAHADPNWPNWLLFLSTFILSIVAAMVVLPIEKRVVGAIAFSKNRARSVWKKAAR
ncbi:AMP-binding protein [Ruegeria sp. HKCCD9179]|uniref:AMP-binding protein n=1 Tax=unclassified Ruegeria TaxID=2625375 RepID=UPI001488934A|nr:AMP-binding protein [Ruegeria sp. HKCCD6109]